MRAESNDVENKIDGKYFRSTDRDVCAAAKESNVANAVMIVLSIEPD